MSGQIKKTDIISEDALKVFSDIVLKFENILKSAKEMKSGIKDGGFKEVTEGAKKAKTALTEVEQAEKDLAAEVARRAALSKQRSSEYIKEMGLRGKAAKKEADTVKQAERAKAAEVARRAALSKQQSREYLAQLRKEEAAEKKAAVGKKNLGQSFKGLITSVGKLAVAYIGVSQARNLLRKIFADTRKLESLDFAFKKVIKSQNELAQTQEYLIDISKRYGLDLLNLSERYLKFRAATISTKLAVQEVQDIFESFAKVSGVLGLKTDEVSGIFLALEQMLSKGKVTTEELRRQLGERLPGAFQIMAIAVGKNTRELDKMLKAGELLSEEIMPKFAKTMEEVYGISTITNINTLTAAQGRFNTQWLEFVKSLDQSDTFKGFLNFFTKFLNDVTYLASTAEYADLKHLIGDKEEVAAIVQDLKDIPYADLLSLKDVTIKAVDEVSGVRAWKARRFWEEYYDMRTKGEQRTRKEQAQMSKLGKLNVPQLEELQLAQVQILKYYQDVKKGDFQKATDTMAYIELIDKEIRRREFDVEKYKSGLKAKKQAFTEYNKLQSEETKAFFAGNNKFITKDVESYKKYLTSLLISEKDNVQARILIEQELFDLDKAGKTKFKIQKEQNKQELELLKLKQQQELALSQSHLAEVFQNESDYNAALASSEHENAIELIDLKIKQQDELLNLVKSGSKEEKAILADRNKLYADKETELTNFQISERKRGFKKQRDDQKEKDDELLGNTYAGINKEALALSEKATTDLQNSKNVARQKRLIELQLNQDILKLESDRLQSLIDTGDLSIDAEKEMADRILAIHEALEKGKRDLFAETEKTKKEKAQETIDFIGQIGQAGFDLAGTLNDAASQRAQNRYDREIQLAGDSTAGQLVAKRKLEKEDRKIAKREAIRKKLETIFSVGLDIAKAIAEYGFISPQALLAGILGGITLAGVAATPLPQFGEGIKEAPGGLSILGDAPGKKLKSGGKEMVIEPSGKKWLSSDTPSIYDIVPGSEIIPHDKTTQILAQQATNATYDAIDMSPTNSVLKEIRDKTPESVSYEGGYKYVRRKGYIGKFKI